MKIKDIIKVTRGELLSGNSNIDISPADISTDSRTINPGELFLALNGSNFRGADFVRDAIGRGAVGAIAEDFDPKIYGSGKIFIKVADTAMALQKIASYNRMQFDIPFIAVTGSNGKTTVKDMISDILSGSFNVLKNEGNKNNHIGVPQALLKLNKDHDICVLELGTNHKGEIRALSAIVRPDVCVITNIGPSHLEFLGDLSGVYREKKDIFRYCKAGSTIVLNGDDKFLSRIKSKKNSVKRYGIAKNNDFYAEVLEILKGKIRFRLNGREEFQLNLLGVHNVYNALAAIVVASMFNISFNSMKRSLKNCAPTYMRLNLKNVNGIDVINDAYNSNPLSMKSALEVIKYYPARAKWVVTGDMMELGEDSAGLHSMMGELIADSDVKGVLAMGDLSRNTLSGAVAFGMEKKYMWHCNDHREAASIIKKFVKKGDVVLIKGSRSMKMEKVLEELEGSK